MDNTDNTDNTYNTYNTDNTDNADKLMVDFMKPLWGRKQPCPTKPYSNPKTNPNQLGWATCSEVSTAIRMDVTKVKEQCAQNSII